MTTASPSRHRKKKLPAGLKPIRCAIYTRKSTEEGLEQEFNSLDAQREAAEAFIASQKHEGWVALKERYDDGGFSGATLERPAVQRLMADVAAGKVDCIVVYKVDRLSRSLLDFARAMEVLDRHGCSFVSVTQQFNTTHSMGRLTLNILLSFAQFEREIISERTSDKMSAARRKGKWVGGRVMLGYDLAPERGKLVVNEDEAKQVRRIFRLFLERGSLMPTVQELNRRGWARKTWVSKRGKACGGKPWDNSNLRRMLTNPAYIGMVTYKGETFPANHEAIVDRETWGAVQALLTRNRRDRGTSIRNKHGALLRGLLWCGSCGVAMHHTYTKKGEGRLYRYYVCHHALKRGRGCCPTKSVPAGEIERFVVDQIRSIGRDPALVADVAARAREQAEANKQDLLEEEATLRHTLRDAARKVAECVGGADAPRRLADLQDRIQAGENRLAEIADALAGAGPEVTAETVKAALATFDGAWDAMPVTDQCRLLALLIERVTYDGETIATTFRENGFNDDFHEQRADH
ncbi:recombinase family protein [Haloferula sp. A504]|uniref:recombinase family protein n=1 Tax=Haloferula sp. A504 TaxID=3373601 RepID=UPI0031C24BF5|nr:recombinase family protein [Verrucomicrobiaceae bacterium E54]